MFLSCLFCLWGSEGKEVSPPSSYVDRDRGSASSSAVGGLEGVMPSRQSSGGLSHEVSATTPLVLSPYYYQHVELLRQLGELYQQNPNDPDICGALARALEKLDFGKDEESEEYNVISDLKRKAGVMVEDTEQEVDGLVVFSDDYDQKYDMVEAFIRKYTNGRGNREFMQSLHADYEVMKVIAPTTSLYTKAAYLSAIGESVEASKVFIAYGALNKTLDNWAEEFVRNYNLNHSS